MHQYEANNNVFRCCLKVSLGATHSFVMSSGSEFHANGPDTEKKQMNWTGSVYTSKRRDGFPAHL